MQMGIMSNYYYICKVPMGREGYLALLQNCGNVQNGLKTIAKFKKIRVKVFALGGAYLNGYGSYAFRTCAIQLLW